MASRILLVDDDRFILSHLVRILANFSCRCDTAVSADDAWQALAREPFDLMILDIGLPDVDGLTFCRRVRAKYRFPIIMLTARDATTDKIVGLEVGADDYIVKPFDPGELTARVRAQLRRNQEYDEPAAIASIEVGSGLVVYPSLKEVRHRGAAVQLTPLEFELLHALARNRDRVLSREWLFENVWGWNSESAGQTLAVTVRRLRCKIEPDPAHPTFIQTVRGFGYKLTGDAEM